MFSFTITSCMLLSLWTGLILFVLSIVALLCGTLPDNDHKPVGDAMRWIIWPTFFVWIIARIIFGKC